MSKRCEALRNSWKRCRNSIIFCSASSSVTVAYTTTETIHLVFAQKFFDYSVNASAHIFSFEPGLRHLHEDDAWLVRREVIAPGFVERILDSISAELGAFETALRIGARLATVGVLDADIIVLALHAGRCDELERNVVEVEGTRGVEFGERLLDLPGAHLVHPIVEALDVLKVEQGLGEVEDTRGFAFALESRPEI